MLDYDTLDAIADTYIPVLALAGLATVAITARKGEWNTVRQQSALLLLGVLLAYGWMFLDETTGLWPAVGLDYSTHTSLAMVLNVFLVASVKRFARVLLLSLAGHFLSMLYQSYHTLLDIVTTAAVVGLCYGLIMYWIRLFWSGKLTS